MNRECAHIILVFGRTGQLARELAAPSGLQAGCLEAITFGHDWIDAAQ